MALQNFINGAWTSSRAAETLEVMDPATAEPLERVPLSPPEEVHRAVEAAGAAWQAWRRVPAGVS